MEINKERIFLLRNGGELIETQERILFSRSSPSAVPLLTEGSVEIDDVLDTLAWREAQVESLRAERDFAWKEFERACAAPDRLQEEKNHLHAENESLRRERDEARQANAALLKCLRWYAEHAEEEARAFHFGQVRSSIGDYAKNILDRYDSGWQGKCPVCEGERRTVRYGRKELGEPHIVWEDCYRCTGKALAQYDTAPKEDEKDERD